MACDILASIKEQLDSGVYMGCFDLRRHDSVVQKSVLHADILSRLLRILCGVSSKSLVNILGNG